MSNISITGSRTYPATAKEWKALSADEKLEQLGITTALVKEFVSKIPKGTTVISGGATGIDSIAVRAAEDCGLETVVLKAEWDKYGKGAGPRRNAQLAALADECLVFWDGESPGTKDYIRKVRRMDKVLYIIGPDGQPWAMFDKGEPDERAGMGTHLPSG